MNQPRLNKKLTLDKNGTWFHDRQIVSHQRLSLLLHRSIAREANSNDLILTTGIDRLYFDCEDTPYFVKEISSLNKNGELNILLSDNSIEKYQDLHMHIGTDHRIRIKVKDKLYWALLLPSAHQYIMNHIDEIDGRYYFQKHNTKIELIEIDFSEQDLSQIPFQEKA